MPTRAQANEFRRVGKPAEIIDALGKRWQQDKSVERKLRLVRALCIIAIVLTVVGFGFNLLLALSIPGVIVFGYYWMQYHRQNVDDRRLLTPIKLLEVLQADIASENPVRLVVSFDDYRKHGKELSKSDSGSSKRYKYEDTWLQADGWLAEKTQFRLEVSQRVALSEKRKRKYTKTKERVRESVSLYLRPNRKLYPALDKFPSHFAPGESVSGMRVETVRTTPRGIFLQAEGQEYSKLSGRATQESGVEHLIQGDKLLMLMAAAFDRLARCRG